MAVSMGVLLLVAVFVGGYWAGRHSGPRIPDYYPVFGPNPAQTKTVVNFWIRLPSNLSLGRKVELLAESLSRFEFCGLPVELVSLKGGTAVFNLLEHPGNIHIVRPPDLAGCAGATWRFTYFQGSTGGSLTAYSLVKTLLQPGAPGPWVRVARFLYQGQPIRADTWVHLGLSGTLTRTEVLHW